MKTKKLFVLLFLSGLLFSCNKDKEKEPDVDNEITSDYIDNLSGENLQKITEKLVYNFSKIQTWSETIKSSLDTTLTENYGKKSSATETHEGFVASPTVLKETAVYTTEKEEFGKTFATSKKAVEYIFKKNNFYGRIHAIEESGVINYVSRETLSPDHPNESLLNLKFNFITESIKSSEFEAWIDSNKKLNFMLLVDESNERRIQQTDNDPGFIGIDHSHSKVNILCEGENIYDQKIVQIDISEFKETNFTKNGDQLDSFVTTEKAEAIFNFGYEKHSSQEPNENQLLSAFNRFNGGVSLITTSGNNHQLVNLSSQIITNAGLNDVYHFYGICNIAAGSTFNLYACGSYSYIESEEDENDVVSYYLRSGFSEDAKINLNSLISKFDGKIEYNDGAEIGDFSFTATENITLEVDIYLNISYAIEYLDEGVSSPKLIATPVAGSIKLLEE